MEGILVSVVVLTYNSEKTIIETLESIKNQTYRNIELIITDDCSNDKTIKICEKWTNENELNFKEIKIIKNSFNTGVSANMNRGIKVARGKWIKLIAGDDILLEKCIEINLNCVMKNPEIKVLFSKMKYFKVETDEKKFLKMNLLKHQEKFYNLSPNKQYEYLLKRSFNMAPTSFIQREVLKKHNYADENFKMIEDLPLWLKFTKNGEKLSYISKETVLYRVGNSITRNKEILINESFLKILEEVYDKLIYEELWKRNKFFYFERKLDFKIQKILIKVFKNRKTSTSVIILKLSNLLKFNWYYDKISLFF
ncbi:MAG: glycosyltransferase family 2 protein [Cetobacterium sp.]